MERCPNCKARYRGGESCHRCGIELTYLLQINQQAVNLRVQIAAALRDNQRNTALKYTQQLRQLIPDPWGDTLYRFLINSEGSGNVSRPHD